MWEFAWNVVITLAIFAALGAGMYGLLWFCSPEQQGRLKYGKEEWERIKAREAEGAEEERILKEARDKRLNLCPVCGRWMKKEREPVSGVMLDRCPGHGVWLDNGKFEEIFHKWWT